MTTIDHHDARSPEETMQNLPPVVPTGSASGRSAAGVQPAGLSDGPPAEDPGELAEA